MSPVVDSPHVSWLWQVPDVLYIASLQRLLIWHGAWRIVVRSPRRAL